MFTRIGYSVLLGAILLFPLTSVLQAQEEFSLPDMPNQEIDTHPHIGAFVPSPTDVTVQIKSSSASPSLLHLVFEAEGSSIAISLDARAFVDALQDEHEVRASDVQDLLIEETFILLDTSGVNLGSTTFEREGRFTMGALRERDLSYLTRWTANSLTYALRPLASSSSKTYGYFRAADRFDDEEHGSDLFEEVFGACGAGLLDASTNVAELTSRADEIFVDEFTQASSGLEAGSLCLRNFVSRASIATASRTAGSVRQAAGLAAEYLVPLALQYLSTVSSTTELYEFGKKRRLITSRQHPLIFPISLRNSLVCGEELLEDFCELG